MSGITSSYSAIFNPTKLRRMPALIFVALKEGNTISNQIPRSAEITSQFVKGPGLMK